MLLKIGTWFEFATLGAGLFVRCWPFGQFHWSRLGFYVNRWRSAWRSTGSRR